MVLHKRDNKHYTYADYLKWPEEQRYEIVDGNAYAMSPGPDLAHQEVAFAIAHQVASQLEGKPCRVFVAPLDVRLPKAGQADERTDTVVQPDVLVVCDPQKLDKRGVRGAPDWIVEVLSPATASHDQVRKRGVYERAGVREFWLVHPIDRVLTVYRLEGTAYGRPDLQELEGETPVGVLPGVVVDWGRVMQWLPVPEA